MFNLLLNAVTIIVLPFFLIMVRIINSTLLHGTYQQAGNALLIALTIIIALIIHDSLRSIVKPAAAKVIDEEAEHQNRKKRLEEINRLLIS